MPKEKYDQSKPHMNIASIASTKVVSNRDSYIPLTRLQTYEFICEKSGSSFVEFLVSKYGEEFKDVFPDKIKYSDYDEYIASEKEEKAKSNQIK